MWIDLLLMYVSILIQIYIWLLTFLVIYTFLIFKIRTIQHRFRILLICIIIFIIWFMILSIVTINFICKLMIYIITLFWLISLLCISALWIDFCLIWILRLSLVIFYDLIGKNRLLFLLIFNVCFSWFCILVLDFIFQHFASIILVFNY